VGGSRSAAGSAGAASGGIYTSMPSGGSSSWGGGGSSSSSGAYASSFVMSSAQSANPANAIAMGSSAGSNSLYSGFAYTSMLDQYQMASYGNTGMNRISGRQNSGEGEDDGYDEAYRSWLEWLRRWGYNLGTENTEKGENFYDFDEDQTYAAFLLWFKMTTGFDYDPNNQTSQITYEEWLRWCSSNGSTHEYGGYTYTFQFPVGDVLPLFIFILIYMVFVAVRRNKHLQKQENNKAKY
jgi:hypothetical protein